MHAGFSCPVRRRAASWRAEVHPAEISTTVAGCLSAGENGNMPEYHQGEMAGSEEEIEEASEAIDKEISESENIPAEVAEPISDESN